MGAGRSKVSGGAMLLALVVACLWAVAASSGQGAEPGGGRDPSAAFEIVHDAVSGFGVRTKLKVKRCPTEVAISGGHARLPAVVKVLVPARSGPRLSAYAAVNGTSLPAPRKWECTASLGVDGTEAIKAGPPGSVVGKHGRSPHLRKGGESVQATLIPACQGCIAATICSFFPQAEVVNVFESTQPCDDKPGGELRFRLSHSAVMFIDPPGVEGASAESGGRLPSIGVVSYKRATGARVLSCTLAATKTRTCAAAIVAFLSLGQHG